MRCKRLFLTILLVLILCACNSQTVEPTIDAATETPTIAEELGILPDPSLPNAIEDPTGVPMILIPAGEFRMGDSSASSGFNTPIHPVLLSDYYIDQYEVTNQQFSDFLNDQGNQKEANATWLDVSASNDEGHLHQVDEIWAPDAGFENHPVVEITWYGAKAFCSWRGARLPSEAEWEKAARGTLDERIYPWGEGITCDLANYQACALEVTVPVDQFPEGVSPYGIYNMSGNASEWTADYPSAYTAELAVNPTFAELENRNIKIVRGGSWFSGADYLRLFHRNTEFAPTASFSNIGFRCAVSP